MSTSQGTAPDGRPSRGSSRRGPGAGEPDGGPIRVVVADDHPAVLSGLVAVLGTAGGIEVVGQAHDGPATVAAARELRPDVVLTDVRMPGATGIDITPALRDLGARVLVVSAFDLDAYVLGALAAGADGYLVKSEDPERFVEAVRQVAAGDAVLSQEATRAVVSELFRHRARPDGDRADLPRGASAPDDRDDLPRGTRVPDDRDDPTRRTDPGHRPGTRPPGVRPADTDGRAAGTRTGESRSAGPVGPPPRLTRREEEVLRLLADGQSNQQIARTLVVETTTVKSHVTHVLAKLQVDSRLQAALWWQRHGEPPGSGARTMPPAGGTSPGAATPPGGSASTGGAADRPPPRPWGPRS